MSSPTTLRARKLAAEWHRRPVLDAVDFEAEAGELVGIVGPNGSGKSTLLRLLAGLDRPVRGQVTWQDRALATFTPAERARALAFLPQTPQVAFGFTARQVVLMGRMAHQHGAFEGPEDRAAAEAALTEMGVADLAGRPVDTLSGGERQRVFLALTLAQDTRALLLDEPLGHLDPGHQMGVCEALAHRAHTGRAVVVVMHDLNLAAQFCDRLVLLVKGQVAAVGPPRAVLENPALAAAYGVPAALIGTHPDGRRATYTPLRRAPPRD